MGSSFEIFLNVVSARMEIAVLRHKCYHKLYCYHIVKKNLWSKILSSPKGKFYVVKLDFALQNYGGLDG